MEKAARSAPKVRHKNGSTFDLKKGSNLLMPLLYGHGWKRSKEIYWGLYKRINAGVGVEIGVDIDELLNMPKIQMISKMGKEKGSGRSANSSGASSLLLKFMITKCTRMSIDVMRLFDTLVKLHSV